MKYLCSILTLFLITALSCTEPAPTGLMDEGSAEGTEEMALGKKGADVLKFVDNMHGLLMVDEKRGLMVFSYGNDEVAEAIFGSFGVFCDFPDADVTAEFQIVINPSNNSGMWKVRGPAALAVYDFDVPLVFPPPGGLFCADYDLIASGVIDVYREHTNDIMFGGGRTLNFGFGGKGVIQSALGSEEISVKMNALGMYRNSDLKDGVFVSLTRNTNVRLSPDPRDL